MTKEFEGVIAYGILAIVTLLGSIVMILSFSTMIQLYGIGDPMNGLVTGGLCLMFTIFALLIFITVFIVCFKRIKYLDDGIEKSIFKKRS